MVVRRCEYIKKGVEDYAYLYQLSDGSTRKAKNTILFRDGEGVDLDKLLRSSLGDNVDNPLDLYGLRVYNAGFIKRDETEDSVLEIVFYNSYGDRYSVEFDQDLNMISEPH